MKKRKVALVLGSGGAKGYAHIGVISALQNFKAEITSIAGTSMGALIGGLYAAGKLNESYNWLKSLSNSDVFNLTDLKNFSHNGLIDGEYIFSKLHKFIGDIRIEQLPIKYCDIAANLDTGKEVVFRTGRLLDAIRASISLPLVFRPYIINGKRYVDGGVVNGLPINRVERTKDDIVIAVNLNTYGEIIEKQEMFNIFTGFSSGTIKFTDIIGKASSGFFPEIIRFFTDENFINILLNSFYISLKQNKIMMEEMMKPEMYINIDLQGHDTFSFSEAEAIMKIGYNQMTTQLINKEMISPKSIKKPLEIPKGSEFFEFFK